MRKIYLFAAAALAMASCSSDEYLAGLFNPNKSNGEITFGTFSEKATRAGETLTGATAAEKLNNNFIVYGFKNVGGNETTDGLSTNNEKVFNLYNVNYEEGTAYTTESNTANWEYVGYDPHNTDASGIKEQTIKYWDYTATGYVFSAVSGTGITAYKAEAAKKGSGTTTYGYGKDNGINTLILPQDITATEYDKGWKVEIPAGGDLSTLYASDRLPIVKPAIGTKYGQVDLTFRALATKIRFAMYETVPGFEVHIDKFYYNNLGTANTTNFAIDGTFKNVNSTKVTPLYITYYKEGTVQNRPKVNFNDADVTTGTHGIFGANIQATPALGTTSVEATYDQSDKTYTMILPYEKNDNILKLKVDYTLTSTDGSGEKIKVTGATANVPANFTQWKPNFAYTYIFKISDNTNGTTGTSDSDVAGLYPITFDAVVVTEDTDVQETITTVSEPSITTYAQGKIVTENDEYTAGDVYFCVYDKTNQLVDLVNHGEVFEVKNFGTIETKITEEVVKNWRNNFCVLMPVPTTTSVTAVPLSDGTELAFAAGKLGVFEAKAGKTYAIHYNTTDSWKIVKVVGTEATAVTYTQTMTTATITTNEGQAVYSVKANSPVENTMVLGANANIKIFKSTEDVTTNFTITDNYDGTYNIGLTPAAIAAGADGTYTVKFNDIACAQTFNVNLHYALRGITSNTINVVAGNKNTFSVTIHNAAPAVPVTEAVIVNENEGITIEETATQGTYQVSAAANKAIGTYTATIAGQTLTINIDSYEFYNVPEFTFNYLGTDDAKTLNLRKNYTDADVEVSAMTGINTSVATITKATAGAYTVVPVAPGTFTVKYENTSATIVVNQYTLTASTASIAKSTGSTVLTLKKNNGETKTVNASTAKVTVKKDASVVTSGFSLTTNGQTLKFGNVTTAGTYTFEYKENTKVVAVATVVVN